MMWYLTRPKEDPSIKQLAASLPYGTQGTYGAPEETPMPNIQDLLREEGIQVGQQVKDGGRVGMKPGGLVAPGVTHYAKTKAEIDKANPNVNRDALRKLYMDEGLTARGEIK